MDARPKEDADEEDENSDKEKDQQLGNTAEHEQAPLDLPGFISAVDLGPNACESVERVTTLRGCSCQWPCSWGLVDRHQLAVIQSLVAFGTEISLDDVAVCSDWLQAAKTPTEKRKAYASLMARHSPSLEQLSAGGGSSEARLT